MTDHTPEILELTTDEFREMLEEYAHYDRGTLRTEAKRLLESLDQATNIHQMRSIANRWSIVYNSSTSYNVTELDQVIVLNLPTPDRLAAAVAALKGTMPSIITLYNQLYAVMRQHNDPGLPELIAFAQTLEEHHPGVRYFLDAIPDQLEDAGDEEAQLDLVIRLLLRQPTYKAAHIFQLVGPEQDYGVAVSDQGYHVAFGDTEVTVAMHPKMNIHSALEVGGLVAHH